MMLHRREDRFEPKSVRNKALHLAATRWDTSDPCRPDTPPPLSHSSPILLLLQAAFCGGWFQGCVHYNSPMRTAMATPLEGSIRVAGEWTSVHPCLSARWPTLPCSPSS
eukprot:scaffold2004_cov107-Isochrysis_galbana.AAC.6